MNRKYNPYVSLAALLLLALVLVFVCTGCAEASAATESRFTQEYHYLNGYHSAYIITDTETGVQYLAYEVTSNYGRGIGLCKLEG